MAKGKKKIVTKPKSAGAAKGPSTSAAAVKREDVPPVVQRVETAYDLGNHSAVRALAISAAGEQLDDKALARVNEAFEKTRTDPLVWAIGIGALVLALIVAMATLGG